jgi:hypothetical protein
MIDLGNPLKDSSLLGSKYHFVARISWKLKR